MDTNNPENYYIKDLAKVYIILLLKINNDVQFPFTESDIDVRIASITASLLVFAVLTFVTGFLLGSLLVKHVMKSSNQDKVVSAPTPGSVPPYDEITRPPSSAALTNQGVDIMKIKTNEAYGLI